MNRSIYILWQDKGRLIPEGDGNNKRSPFGPLLTFYILFVISTILGADIIQPPFIVRASTVLVWYSTRSAHLIQRAILWPIAESFKSELLSDASVVLDRNICHAGPFTGKAFTLPAGLVQHTAATTPVINRKRRKIIYPRF